MNYGRICHQNEQMVFHMTRAKTILLSAITLSVGLLALVWWKLSPVSMQAVGFDALPGWQQARLAPSLLTFKRSCQAFFKQNPEKPILTSSANLKVKALLPICLAANQVNQSDEAQVRAFFERYFQPYQFQQHQQPAKGLFTGYYLPALHGDWHKSTRYQYPLYGLPQDLVQIKLADFDPAYGKKTLVGKQIGRRIVPYPKRAQIEQGGLPKAQQPLLWVENLVERFFLEIQGSGYIDMANGERVMVGYAGQNGQPYTPVGRFLISQGLLDKNHISMQAIKSYLETHPQQTQQILNQNESYVFFRLLPKGEAYGSQGVGLTAGYSMAVDVSHMPLGLPVWLSTSYPSPKGQGNVALNRLMIAQDTGGAIKGKVRGDVFWGGGDNAGRIAGHMKNSGSYWLLLPKS